MALNDNEIRPQLIKYLREKNNKQNKIIEELPVCFGNAIADIVTADRFLHCYEIKGETDSIQRINTQGLFYNQAFYKITLVTTKNHEKYALKNAPSYWGIVIAEGNDYSVSFKVLRNARVNPDFSKEEALHTLWKNELLQISENEQLNIKETLSKKAISAIVSKAFTKQIVARYISNLVSQRI